MDKFFKRSGLKEKDCCPGFTMIEIIAVLVILGVIAAVAVARYQDSGADEIAAASTLKAHLRYAQLRAMGDIVPWGIELESGSYTLQRDGDEAPVNLPGESKRKKDLEKMTLSPVGTITFSPARGIPDPNGQTITIGNQVITITPETGFIP